MINELGEGVQGALTHMLLANKSSDVQDDLPILPNDHSDPQTMLNKLQVQKKFLTVNTHKSEVMCLTVGLTICPPYSLVVHRFFTRTVSLHRQLSTLTWGMKQMNLSFNADAGLQPFTIGTFCVQQFVHHNYFANRLQAPILAPLDICNSCWHVRDQIWATPCCREGKEMDNPMQKWLLKTFECSR